MCRPLKIDSLKRNVFDLVFIQYMTRLAFSKTLSSTYELDNNWKTQDRIWEHSLHSICSRTGAFPSALARYFIFRYSKSADTILDPFAGKGTAPLEACIFGRIGIGNDLSPEAYVQIRAKVKPPKLKYVRSYLTELRKQITKPLTTDVAEEVEVFYSPQTLAQITRLRLILNNDTTDTANFVKAAMCGIIHGNSSISLSLPCSHFFSMSPNYVKKYAAAKKLKRPHRDVIYCLARKIEQVLQDPLPTYRGKAFNNDAAKIPLKNETVNLIITSPPYLNKQTYAWDNWLRLWFLGYDYKSIAKKLFSTGSLTTYLDQMKDYLRSAYTKLKPNSAAVIVIGDVIINHKLIKTGEYIADVADELGFKVKYIIKDQILNGSLNHIYHPTHFDLHKRGRLVDRIIVLHKGNPKEYRQTIPWVPFDVDKRIVQN